MTVTLALQAFLAPIVLLLIAAFSRKWYPIILAAGFWGISLWVKGFALEAMDSVAIAFTIAAINALLIDKVKTHYRVPVAAVLLVILSIWQVKNFAADLPIMSWVIQFAFLAVTLLLPEWKVANSASETKFLGYADVSAAFWLVPVGAIAFLSPFAGSIVVGQMAGLIAMLVLGAWFYSLRSQATAHQLAVLVATPTLFIAQMAWHYVEIPWTSLSIAILGWLPLLWPGLKKQPWWVQTLILVVFFAAILGSQLYLEWPEESLY